MSNAEKALAVLQKIQDGTLTVSPLDDWDYIYCGNVRYRSECGIEVVVFNDCDSWDYIDSISGPGWKWEFPDTVADEDPLDEQVWTWEPESEAACACFGWSIDDESPKYSWWQWIDGTPEDYDEEYLRFEWSDGAPGIHPRGIWADSPEEAAALVADHHSYVFPEHSIFSVRRKDDPYKVFSFRRSLPDDDIG